MPPRDSHVLLTHKDGATQGSALWLHPDTEAWVLLLLLFVHVLFLSKMIYKRKGTKKKATKERGQDRDLGKGREATHTASYHRAWLLSGALLSLFPVTQSEYCMV